MSDGFNVPNTTQTPDALFAMMPAMNEAELRVTLYLVRQTFGWRRDWSDPEHSTAGAMARGTGLTPKGVRDGVRDGMARGTIERKPAPETQSFTYRLKVKGMRLKVTPKGEPQVRGGTSGEGEPQVRGEPKVPPRGGTSGVPTLRKNTHKHPQDNADALDGGAREPVTEAEAPSARAVFGAVCDALGKDPTMIDSGTRQAVAKLARECRERGITEANIRAAGEGWYTRKWSFKPRANVRPPSAAQLRTWLGECFKRTSSDPAHPHALTEDAIRERWPGLTVIREGRIMVKGMHALACEGVVEKDSYDYLDRSTWPADVRECVAAVAALHGQAVGR